MHFLKKAEVELLDKEDQKHLADNLANLAVETQESLSQLPDLVLAKKQAKNIRHQALKNLDSHLIRFEEKIKERKGKVYWAEDTPQAIDIILKLIKQTQPKSIFTGNASELQEIELEGVLQDQKIDFHSTEIGQFLLRYLRKKSRHPVHHLISENEDKLKQILRQIFAKEDTANSPPTDLISLLEKYKETIIQYFDFPVMGITNADFLLADSGGIFVSDNQGSQSWLASCSNIHIVVAGIERVLPTSNDLQHILPLYSAYHYGKPHSSFNTLLYGPLQEEEIDGPTQLYVILLDNGRSTLLNSPWREMLYDMECSAPLNTCPVYHNLQQQHYHAQFTGIAGAILTPLLYEGEDYPILPFLHLTEQDEQENLFNMNTEKMLLKTRKEVLDKQPLNRVDKFVKKQWTEALLDKKKLKNLNSGLQAFLFKKAFQQSLGSQTQLPNFAKQSFHDWWQTNEIK